MGFEPTSLKMSRRRPDWIALTSLSRRSVPMAQNLAAKKVQMAFL
jgi:hypothetical protein